MKWRSNREETIERKVSSKTVLHDSPMPAIEDRLRAGHHDTITYVAVLSSYN